jgi:hypothetical protein
MARDCAYPVSLRGVRVSVAGIVGEVKNMRWALLPVACVVTLVQALAAFAKPLPEGGVTVDEVAAVLRAAGLNAEVGKDDQGDPKIRSLNEGGDFEFYVYFYDCKNDRCSAIQFSEGYDMPNGISCERIDAWNRDWRYGRAFRDKENDPWLQMDVDVLRGSSTESIDNNLEVWLTVLREFQKHLATQAV